VSLIKWRAAADGSARKKKGEKCRAHLSGGAAELIEFAFPEGVRPRYFILTMRNDAARCPL